jgi:hypothetical protein
VEKLKEARDLAGQCCRYLKTANGMLEAADACLRDPESGRYTLDPRSTEVAVIFTELVAGKPVRRKALLSQLPARLENSGLTVHRTGWRIAEPRDLLLKAIDRGAKVVELMGKLSGELATLPDLELVVRLVTGALRPHPADL